jgi:hypothetical protein
MKVIGEDRDTYYVERKSIFGLEGSQASPSRPSDKDSGKVKAL